jgi:regulator of CtrA degradation
MQATAFFGKTYGEAMSLLTEARDYIAHQEPADRRRAASIDALIVSRETTRLTARLTQIMAWLLAQRAVQEGEMSQRDALEDVPALADLPVCLEDIEPCDAVPVSLQELLERSRLLYVRVARLDQLARRHID